jgi:hypothetical protein
MAAGTGAPPEIPGPPGQDSQGALAAAISAGSKPSTTGTGTGTATATATATATIISTPLTEIATRHPAEMLSLMAGTRQARNRVPVSVYRPWAPNVWLGHAVSGLKSCPAISGPAARLRDSGNFAH